MFIIWKIQYINNVVIINRDIMREIFSIKWKWFSLNNTIIRIGICKIKKEEIIKPLGLYFNDSINLKSYKLKKLLVIPQTGQGNPVNLLNKQKCGIELIKLIFIKISTIKIRIVLIRIFQFICWISLSVIFLIKNLGIMLISIIVRVLYYAS